MKAKIKLFSNRFGVDGAITFTVLSRLVQAGGGVVSILFIAQYLSKMEQGYYFTFGSLLAIQIFFELGLSNIIIQFVAHEKANLHWVSKSQLGGSAESLSRLSSLLRFCVKWFSVIATLLIFVLLLTGYLFFNRYGTVGSSINWQMPWAILAISTALSLLISPILAFLEGLGKVKEVAKIRLLQQSLQLLALFLCLRFGFKLYSPAAAAILAFTVAPLWIFFSYKKVLLQNIWLQLKEWKVNYKLEIFPYQWRIALSWISGYFIFQLFNPVLFATDGPIVAGQMGMSLAALNGVLSISLSWINTKVPLLSGLIARKEYEQLDLIFNRTVKQACLVSGLLLILFILGVYILQLNNVAIGNRFLPIIPLFLLAIATFVNQLISALATYIRCHKQEPFLIQSVVIAIFAAFSTLILGSYFGVMGMTIGYTFLIVFVSLVWTIVIFNTNKVLWHQ